MNGHLAVVSILKTSGPVGTYIGGSGLATARVFIGEAAQSLAYPMIRVEMFDGESFPTKSGAAFVDHDVVKVFCEADGTDAEATCYALAKAVRTALEGTGQVREGAFSGIYVEDIIYRMEDAYDNQLTNKKIRVHEQDYQVRTRV